MEATKPRIIELTPGEKRRLQNVIIGYGKLKEAATKSGLHFHTLRNVARIGHGEPDTIEAIKSTLLSNTAA